MPNPGLDSLGELVAAVVAAKYEVVGLGWLPAGWSLARCVASTTFFASLISPSLVFLDPALQPPPALESGRARTLAGNLVQDSALEGVLN